MPSFREMQCLFAFNLSSSNSVVSSEIRRAVFTLVVVARFDLVRSRPRAKCADGSDEAIRRRDAAQPTQEGEVISRRTARNGMKRDKTQKRVLNGAIGARVLEARVGIEPTNKGFADPCLTTWLPRRWAGLFAL